MKMRNVLLPLSTAFLCVVWAIISIIDQRYNVASVFLILALLNLFVAKLHYGKFGKISIRVFISDLNVIFRFYILKDYRDFDCWQLILMRRLVKKRDVGKIGEWISLKIFEYNLDKLEKQKQDED